MDRETINKIQAMIDDTVARLTQNGLLPKSIKQRHIEGDLIFRGLAADLPDGTTHVKCYFATDTGVLSIWSGTAWLTTTLT